MRAPARAREPGRTRARPAAGGRGAPTSRRRRAAGRAPPAPRRAPPPPPATRRTSADGRAALRGSPVRERRARDAIGAGGQSRQRSTPARDGPAAPATPRRLQRDERRRHTSRRTATGRRRIRRRPGGTGRRPPDRAPSEHRGTLRRAADTDQGARPPPGRRALDRDRQRRDWVFRQRVGGHRTRLRSPCRRSSPAPGARSPSADSVIDGLGALEAELHGVDSGIRAGRAAPSLRRPPRTSPRAPGRASSRPSATARRTALRAHRLLHRVDRHLALDRVPARARAR